MLNGYEMTASMLLVASMFASTLLTATVTKGDAPQPTTKSPTSPWKYDIDIVVGTRQYNAYHLGDYGSSLYCDQDDRLWLVVDLIFGAHTDAYTPRSSRHILVSHDRGLSWAFTDRQWPRDWPGLSRYHLKLAGGTLIELAPSVWERHPRSEIDRLEQEGYFVWDLGEKEGYCAILYAMWIRRSTDGGTSWQEIPVHKQLAFFARFGIESLRQLDDGTILGFGYGFEKPVGKRTPHNRRSSYVVRSSDDGTSWQRVKIADGRISPTQYGFGETMPVVFGDGRILVMLRTGLGGPAYVARSTDGGKTWTGPERTPIVSKHPRAARLADGTIVCAYPRRFARPFGIRARLTTDMGKTWSNEIILRDDLALSDSLREPYTVELSDGTLFTCAGGRKYLDDGKAPAFVFGTRWSRTYRGPLAPKMSMPAEAPMFKTDASGPDTSPWQKQR